MTVPICSPLANCKVCGVAAPLLGVVDFHKQCLKNNSHALRPAGIPIYYRQCQSCGFTFTDAFDGWSHDEFASRIYNAEQAFFAKGEGIEFVE